jgi:hypothetical protein
VRKYTIVILNQLNSKKNKLNKDDFGKYRKKKTKGKKTIQGNTVAIYSVS